MKLREEQLWFAGAVMTGAAHEEADHRLTAGPKLGPRERLDVYRHAYVARLIECLADDYPVLKVALGDDAFDALCRGYIARFPSEAHLVASPGLRLLTLGHPANDYFQAVRDGHVPAIPTLGASATVVYRSGLTVWRMGLTPPMHRVLAALVGGVPLEAALALAEGEPPEQVTAWFREWVSSGLFVGVEVG
jgi:hypothetical protein